MHPRVWEASGHVGSFSDPLIDCKNCKMRHRADNLINDYSNQYYDNVERYLNLEDYTNQLNKAANAVGLGDLDPVLHGPTALAISDDPVAPAKVIADFAKENECIQIKAGFLQCITYNSNLILFATIFCQKTVCRKIHISKH